ncbi:MAG: flagellar hook-associated protein FlgK [Phycisphaeraceae bacterium]|nr:flagellar hook-associated protein FlgK [Phycisphaeraceae bacterium]MCB9847981.1 flagellar hook-associated protein FlgK [Phycisphaeraceae bacterium]
MSLTSSLLIGRSALAASQIAIRVTGDNIANAATPGYHRRVATLNPIQGQVTANGLYQGRGVEVTSINRRVEQALSARIRTSISQEESALVNQDLLSQIESLTSNIDGSGVSGHLEELFDAFSELANNPASTATRSLIVESAQTVAQYLQRLRLDLVDARKQIDVSIEANVERSNELLSEIASLNEAIVTSEQGRTENAALRDQRESLVAELATYLDVSVTEHDNGSIDLYVGSDPVVTGTNARGLKTLTVDIGGEPTLFVATVDREAKLNITSGRLGALLDQRSGDLQDTIDRLDELASGLIFEVNRLHSQGRPFSGLDSTLSERRVALVDQTLAFNDPTNATFADLPFATSNGSFEVVVRDKATGAEQRVKIDVDLDGIDNTGAAGFADDTTLASLVADLNAVPDLSATITASGQVQLTAGAGFEFSFANDTSGALATLGINTFFTGVDGTDIGVRSELSDDPLLLVAGESEGSNEAALAIAQLRDTPVDSAGGVSLTEHWRQTTERIAVQTRAAGTRAAAASDVRLALESQEASISGVSIDEESINLITYQRQYQAAAQFINVIDEMTQILLSLI